MFPIKDENPTETKSYITIILIFINIIVYLYQASLTGGENYNLILQYGFKPSHFFSLHSNEFYNISPFLTILTSMFMHGGLLHLLGNMLFLWIYGNNIEDSMGHIKFLIFYFTCGFAAALLQAIVSPGSSTPMIGASGAVSGVLSAYFLLFPKARVLTLIILIFFILF